ncbi:MAG: hypothetical protein A2038_13460 [Deltaproteobacteria bacterium GWA2_57_13]|nr:MAG: hypothetical protein A2038_13460 [Deltaproteobacteria bacterium GWA2_57_13]OGQ77787.1 MAG: hypothetical protein A3G40_05555 [Deltaproteobacteria bacterium RIFCSPLOWO2_12_FULL_57_22]
MPRGLAFWRDVDDRKGGKHPKDYIPAIWQIFDDFHKPVAKEDESIVSLPFVENAPAFSPDSISQ